MEKKIKIIQDRYSKGELAKEILKGLAVGGIIIASFALPNLPQILTLFGANKTKDRQRIKKSLQSLKRERLINIYSKDGNEVLEITENGKKRVLKYKFEEMQIARPKKWDGYWRIVAFDIPENWKEARDALTQKLKIMEFYPFQKSVFVYPFECRHEIDFIGEFFDIRKFINYFVVREMEREKEDVLKKHYNL